MPFRFQRSLVALALLLACALHAGCSDDSSDGETGGAGLEVVVDFNVGDGRLATDAPIAAGRITVERSGDVLLADGYEVRRVSARTGKITAVPGTHLTTCADGSSAEALCGTGITAVAADPHGRIYFSTADDRVLRVGPDGGTPELVAGRPGEDCVQHLPIAGRIDDVCFAFITDLAFDPAGRLVVADGGNARVFRLDETAGTATVVAGIGFVNDPLQCADGVQADETCIGLPSGIAVGRDGAVFVASPDLPVRRVDPVTGIIRAVAGRVLPCRDGATGDGGLATDACLGSIEDVAVDGAGTLYLADSYRHRIRRVDADTGVITTFDGSDDDAPLPVALAVDDDDRLFAVSYRGNFEARELRRFGAGPGSGTLVAGNGSFGFCGDGGPARDACLGYTNEVALGPDGSIYVAGAQRVRRITGGTIATVAGNGMFPDAQEAHCRDGVAAVDTCVTPGSLAVDRAGTLFVQEGNAGGDDFNRVRRVDARGMIDTIIGGCRVEGDATTMPAADACVHVADITAAPNGVLWVAESTRVSRFDAEHGRLVPVASAPPDCDFSTDGARPECFFVQQIAVDRTDRVYVSDPRGRVRRIDPETGAIAIVAGNGTLGTCGDGGLATDACLFGGRVVPDRDGNLFLAAAGTVRRVDAATGIITTVAGTSDGECAFNDGTVVPPNLGCASVHAIDGEGRFVYPEDSLLYVGRVVRLGVPVGRPVP